MSEIRAETISDAAGTGPITLTKQSAAKAWVNFNGTGTVAIRDSFNLSSITDHGTGNYTENFSSAFSAADYAVGAFTGGSASSRDVVGDATAFSASTCEIFVTNSAETVVDSEIVTTSTHGDLA